MTPLKYDAIQWIKDNTAENSVLVANGNFGWWVSGFAQRPTLASVNPQYLILAHELEVAEAAGNILSTDYLVDNGLLQINYVDNGSNSLALSGRIGDSFVLHPFFWIKNGNVTWDYQLNNQQQNMRLDTLVQNKIEVNKGQNWAAFTITYENSQFTVSEVITIQKGLNYAKIDFDIQNKNGTASFDWLHIPFISTGAEPASYSNVINYISLVCSEKQTDKIDI
jgi:hypothetical protein